MTRPQRPKKYIREIASRFDEAMTTHLQMNATDLSKALGYANPSTIHAITKRTSLPDFVRLAEHIDILKDAHGRQLNFHWLITGDGQPMLSHSTKWQRRPVIHDDNIIKNEYLSPEKKIEIITAVSTLIGANNLIKVNQKSRKASVKSAK